MKRKETNNNKTAVVYIRYTETVQVEQQKALIYNYALENGFDVVNEYLDAKNSHEQFDKMLEDVNGYYPFQYVLVSSIDRLSRDRYTYTIYRQQLKELGVKVISVMEGNGNASSINMESILKAMAEYHPVKQGEKIKRCKQRKAKELQEKCEKLKGKRVRRMDVLAQLSEQERRVIFDNMGYDFETANKQVLDYKQDIKDYINELYN